MTGEINRISNHQFLRHISGYSYYSSLISSLRIWNISHCFWNLLKLLYRILNNYIIAWKTKSPCSFTPLSTKVLAINALLFISVSGIECLVCWQINYEDRKPVEYLSLQAEATFYRLLESAEIKVGLNPCENELEILWGENVILVSIITDIIIWSQPEEVLQFRTDCISVFFFPQIKFFFWKYLGLWKCEKQNQIDNLKIS